MPTRVQNLDEAVCISYNTNIHGKGMHPTILFPDMSEIVRQAGLFNLAIATSLGEGKL